LKPAQAIIYETIFGKYPAQKRAGEVVHVVEHFPSKSEAQNSNPTTAKNKKDLNVGNIELPKIQYFFLNNKYPIIINIFWKIF
jgi:hypothetical protein